MENQNEVNSCLNAGYLILFLVIRKWEIAHCKFLLGELRVQNQYSKLH